MKEIQNNKKQFFFAIIILIILLVSNYKEILGSSNETSDTEATQYAVSNNFVDTPAIDIVPESPNVEKQKPTNHKSEKTKQKLRLVDRTWIKGEGTIIKVLPDDTNPPRHQRILIKIDDNRTLLIAHNIDLAPRVEAPQKGDSISFYGEYIDNDQGGLIHWTHHNPDGGRGGYLLHNSYRYE